MMAHCLLLVMALALGACSSVPLNTFDPPRPPDGGPHVALHYLGNGGWLISRDRDRIATAPYVSHTRWYALPFPTEPDTTLIDRLIPAMHDVGIILVSHGHYDHNFDLPHVAVAKAPQATIYGGPTVVNTLAAVPKLNGRLETIELKNAATRERPGQWIYSQAGAVRFMPLRSTHAPHFAGIKVIPTGTVAEKQTKLPWGPYWWKEGETLAFIIDFLDGPDKKDVAFRIYYQDAASRPGTGVVPRFEGRDAARVDAAILCVAAFDQVDGNPEHILTNVQPRSIIGGHWEDFFSRSYEARPVRPAFGTSLRDFNDRARAVSSAPIYLPEPGQKLYLPIESRR
jgi:hypothetical protein